MKKTVLYDKNNDSGQSVSFPFEKHNEEARKWFREVAHLLDTPDREDQAYLALKGGLFALRDRLQSQEVFHLSAQLPFIIRGILFEGYQPEGKPEKFHAGELLDRIKQEMTPTMNYLPGSVFEAVLQVLHRHVSRGELDDIYAAMPKDIRDLWDEAVEN